MNPGRWLDKPPAFLSPATDHVPNAVFRPFRVKSETLDAKPLR